MSASASDRRRADDLQLALERYERALAKGTDPKKARAAVAKTLGADAQIFMLATGLADAAAPVPEPAFAEMFARRLRKSASTSTGRPAATSSVRPMVRTRRSRLTYAPLAIAACIVALAILLVPAMRSLPGDNLYALKGFTEGTRILFASGASEARVRLDVANERFTEVEQLVKRSKAQAIAVTNRPLAASAGGVTDAEVVKLIEQAVAEAGAQIEAAANILIAEPGVRSDDLDVLLAIAQRGRTLVASVAEELPSLSDLPVMDTDVTLAKVEAKAKAAKMRVAAKPTPPPCATPTPTPDPSAMPSSEPNSNATSTATDGEATPKPTPCLSPSPTPEPTEEPDATPDAKPDDPAVTSEPSSSSEPQPSENPASDGDDGSGEEPEQQSSQQFDGVGA